VAQLIDALGPHPALLAAAVAMDLAIGDPVYAWHPVRLIGRAVTRIENGLWRIGATGYGGGVLLCLALASLTVAVAILAMAAAVALSAVAMAALHVLAAYSLLALGSLLRHIWTIERAARQGDLPRTRASVSDLVGRDTDAMDIDACRRAGVESLSENLTDGFVSPLFWYVVLGLPGLVLFKVASTMDSMVGYKTPRYLKFGWCGARLDDAMNFVPARLTWLGISLVAAVTPTYSGRKAWTVGLRQHARPPSPNSGWSEAATAGALECRLAGPIWLGGRQVTDVWIGDPGDPPLAGPVQVVRALLLTLLVGLLFALIAVLVLEVT
jgi:adenosylcobinamide-phosphate synthase